MLPRTSLPSPGISPMTAPAFSKESGRANICTVNSLSGPKTFASSVLSAFHAIPVEAPSTRCELLLMLLPLMESEGVRLTRAPSTALPVPPEPKVMRPRTKPRAFEKPTAVRQFWNVLASQSLLSPAYASILYS